MNKRNIDYKNLNLFYKFGYHVSSYFDKFGSMKYGLLIGLGFLFFAFILIIIGVLIQ